MDHGRAFTIWLHLQQASDLEYILRECLSDLALVIVREDVPDASTLLQSVYLCKNILDYQRICLSHVEPSQYVIVDPDSVLSAIVCLSKLVKFCLGPDLHPRLGAHSEHVLLCLRQAFFAGIRVLLLLDIPDALRKQVSDGVDSCHDLWNTGEALDVSITKPVIDAAVRTIRDSSHPASVLKINKAVGDSSQTEIQSQLGKTPTLLKDENQHSAVIPDVIWGWCDTRLALFKASYQFLDVAGQGGGIPTYRKSSVEGSAEILKIYNDLDAIMQRLPSLNGGSHSIADFVRLLEPRPCCQSCGCGCFSPTTHPQPAIQIERISTLAEIRLIARLERRKMISFHASKELEKLSNTINLRRMDFEVNDPEDVPNGAEPRLPAQYILNCPKMHCVSGSTLRRWIENFNVDVKDGLDELSRESELIRTWVKCRVCLSLDPRGETDSTVELARKITPLSQISDLVASLQTTAAQFEQDSTEERSQEADEDTSSENEYNMPASGDFTANSLAHIREKPQRKNTDSSRSDMRNVSYSSSKRSRHDRGNYPGSNSGSKIPYATMITPDRRYVFVWYKSTLAVFNPEIKYWSHPWRYDKDIELLSVSNKLYAIVTQNAAGFEVSVNQTLHSNSPVIKPLQISSHVNCMALSPDGLQLIYSTDREIVRIILRSTVDLHDPQIQRRALPAPRTVSNWSINSQCISFSCNAQRAVLATRYGPDGSISIIILDGVYRDKVRIIAPVGWDDPIPIKSLRDYGLTSCPCHYDVATKTTTWMLCSAIEGSEMRMRQLRDPSKEENTKAEPISIGHKSDWKVGSSIIQAISLSASHGFLVIDDRYHVFSVQKGDGRLSWTSTQLHLNESIYSTITSDIRIASVSTGKCRLLTYDPEKRPKCQLNQSDLKMVPDETDE